MARKEPGEYGKISWIMLREVLCKGTYICSELDCADCILDTPDEKEFKEWMVSKLKQENMGDI